MSKRGFTLIELLTVVAIISLLLAISSSALRATREKAKSVQCSYNIRQLGLAIAVYEADNGTFPYGLNVYDHKLPPGGYAGSGDDRPGWWWFNYLYANLYQTMCQLIIKVFLCIV